MSHEWKHTYRRVNSRFFAQVGPETMYASCGNHNVFTIRPTNIMNRAHKDWAHFKKIEYFSTRCTPYSHEQKHVLISDMSQF